VDGIITASRGWRRDPFTGQPEFHSGLDISARVGAPIHAPADGVVSDLGYNAGFGNTIVLSHGYGYLTRYAHMHNFAVTLGQSVRRGDVIGYVGTTGRSTGPHLHYEVLVNNEPVNPRNFILEEARQF
jgi:murein DD-endopeptidase MepM/ murein hydrolase activator NlpD